MACGVQLYLETNGTRYQPPSSSNSSSVGEQRHRTMSLKEPKELGELGEELGEELVEGAWRAVSEYHEGTRSGYDCCRLEGHYKTNNTRRL